MTHSLGSGRRKYLWAVPIAVLTLSGSSVAGSAEDRLDAPSALAPGLEVSVQLDAYARGGDWTLSTMAGDNGTEGITLHTGFVATDGFLHLRVSPLEASKSTTGQYYLRAWKRLGTNQAHITSLSTGVAPEEIAQGIAVDFGSPRGQVVAIYDSPTAAISQAPRCGSACSSSADLASQLQSPIPATNLVPATPVLGGARTENSSARRPTPVVEPPSLADGGGAGTRSVAVTTASNGCGIAFLGSDCIVSAHDIYGVRSFRGYSHRPSGARNVFRVEASNTQQWQNGHRFSAGPFTANGSTSRQKTITLIEDWPRRGDCWSVNTTYNDVDCSGTGRHFKTGSDTWRWEKHLISSCFFGVCSFSTEEILREKSYDGGTQGDGPEEFVNYYAHPDDIEAGRWGSRAVYGPGFRTSVTLDQSVTYGNGAEITVGYPEAFSSASFSSDVTNSTAQKVHNMTEFRNDLPWFTQPGGPLPHEAGKWYRYDNKTSWRWEYYSCKWASGWVGSTNCWPR